MTDNVLDAIFEIDRNGALLRTITIADLKPPLEDNTDAEGITWMYGERFAVVLEGGEEMAIINISSSTTDIKRAQAAIHDLSGDPKGVAYSALDDSLYWVSQTGPMRVVKARLHPQTGQLQTIWNKNVDNLPEGGLADVAVFPRLSPHLFLVGQSSNTLMEVDITGTTGVLKSEFSIAEWDIPRPGAMAFDPKDGSFRLVGKHAAGLPQDDFNIFVPTAPFPNLPPLAHAGGNLELIDFDGTGALTNIDASQSRDDDGAIISYEWLLNGVSVAQGFGPRVATLSRKFELGTSTLTLVVRDDALVVNQTTIQVFVREFIPGEQIPIPFPQPAGMPAVSLNFIHPGSGSQQAEFYFELSQSGSGDIRVYDQVGRIVKTIQTPTFPAGQYRAPWDLRNDDGEQVASGVYFVLIKTPEGAKKEKLVVVR